jgi:hypothetical protein
MSRKQRRMPRARSPAAPGEQQRDRGDCDCHKRRCGRHTAVTALARSSLFDHAGIRRLYARRLDGHRHRISQPGSAIELL